VHPGGCCRRSYSLPSTGTQGPCGQRALGPVSTSPSWSEWHYW
jgi:hypothetical protein